MPREHRNNGSGRFSTGFINELPIQDTRPPIMKHLLQTTLTTAWLIAALILPLQSHAAAANGVPTLDSVKGLPTMLGPVSLDNGQVLEKVHVVNPKGPCIIIDGKRDVVIRDSEIGPCGQETQEIQHSGVFIVNGSTRITIERNVLHDAPTLISVNSGVHPFIIRNNLFYNIRGTVWALQAIGIGETRKAAASTKILCNVMDDTLIEQRPMAGGRERKVEDHINLYNSGGTAQFPVEIAYNRIRGADDGKGGQSGSGMQLGDSPAGGGGKGSNVPGYFFVHDNIVYHVNGQGIAIAGGVGSVVQNNMVDNRGASMDSMTGWAFGLRNFDGDKPASVTYTGNKGIANLWAYNHDGQRWPAFDKNWRRSGFDVTDGGGNDWQYDFKTNIWDEPLNPACRQ